MDGWIEWLGLLGPLTAVVFGIGIVAARLAKVQKALKELGDVFRSCGATLETVTASLEDRQISGEEAKAIIGQLKAVWTELKEAGAAIVDVVR